MNENIYYKIIKKFKSERKSDVIIKIIHHCFCISFAIIFVLLFRILSLFFYIRLGSIDIGRIGGTYQGDWYLCEKLDGKHKGRHIDFFYFRKSTAHVNSQWLKMWKKALPWVPGCQIWNYVLLINRKFSGFHKFEIESTHTYPDLKKWKEHMADLSLGIHKKYNDRLSSVLKNKKNNISFTNKENIKGRMALSELKIPSGASYICFHARDSSYLEKVAHSNDWGYHNYRDSKIENYLLAAEKMTSRGYYLIRMGAIVEKSIKSTNPKIIDYSMSSNRSDFNDIYIGSHCRFFICSDGGMSIIPEMFKVPIVLVNWTIILRISTWVENGLIIFKKFYLQDQKRYLTFSEIINLDFGGDDTSEVFSKLGLVLEENTPEEISSVTEEMDERLNGTWISTEEDEELQKVFWSLFGPDKLKSPDLRIGAKYLRRNKDLLR